MATCRCDRCGRAIKEVFTIGGSNFGSECIFHAADFLQSEQLKQERQSLGKVKTPIETFAKAVKRLKKEKKQFLQEMPEIGFLYKHAWSRYVEYAKPTEIYWDVDHGAWRVAFEEKVDGKIQARKISIQAFLESYRRPTE